MSVQAPRTRIRGYHMSFPSELNLGVNCCLIFSAEGTTCVSMGCNSHVAGVAIHKSPEWDDMCFVGASCHPSGTYG